MHFGADYYPEYWPQDNWEQDASLMQEARFDIADVDPVPIVQWDGQMYDTVVWADMVEPTGAEVIARYTNEWYAPYAAITGNKVGKEEAIYVVILRSTL